MEVLIRDDGVTLVDNNIITTHIDNDGWLVCCLLTDKNQMEDFLLNHAPNISYNTVKCCYEDDMMVNINTCEVRKIRP